MAKGAKTGGRQKGVPNKATAEIKAVAQKHGPKAIARLAELAGLVTGKNAKAAESDAAQVAALKEILDRGYGKAAQAIVGPTGGPVQIEDTTVRPTLTRAEWLALHSH